MTFDEIRRVLETTDRTPDDALRAATAHATEFLPFVVELIEKLKDGVYLMPGQDRLLFYGVHVLAAAGHKPFWPAWLDLLRLPPKPLQELLGDVSVTIVTGVTLSLADSDLDPVLEILESAPSDVVRWALFHTLARLTWEGRLEADRTRVFLDRFEREGLAPEDDLGWLGWIDAVMLLGEVDLAQAIRRVYAKSALSFHRETDLIDTLTRLEAARADFGDETRFMDEGIAPFTDPVEALAWLKDIEASRDAEAPSPVAAPRDPIGDVRLTPAEEGWLRGFLESAQVPETTMRLEMVDGFFCAAIIGPDIIPTAECFPYVWGGSEPADDPAYDTIEQAIFVRELLLRRWNGLARELLDRSHRVPRHFNDPDFERGQLWATGFIVGMSLRAEAWMTLVLHPRGRIMLAAISTLADPDVEFKDGSIAPESRAKIADSLPGSIYVINNYWRDPASLDAGLPGQGRKVGRNDPCPCGSGRKYKKCCGASGVAGTPEAPAASTAW